MVVEENHKMILKDQLEMFGKSQDEVINILRLRRMNLNVDTFMAEIGIPTHSEVYFRSPNNPPSYNRSMENEFPTNGGYLLVKLNNEVPINHKGFDYLVLNGPLTEEEAKREIIYLEKLSSILPGKIHKPLGIINAQKKKDKSYVAQVGFPVINFSDMECLTDGLSIEEKTSLLSRLAEQLLTEWAILAKNGYYMTEITPIWHVHTNSKWVYGLSSYGGGVVGPSCYSNMGLIRDGDINTVFTGLKDIMDPKEVIKPISNFNGDSKRSRMGRALTSMAMAITYQGMAMGIEFNEVSSIVESSFSKCSEILTGDKGLEFKLDSRAEDEIIDYMNGEMIDSPPFVNLLEQLLGRYKNVQK